MPKKRTREALPVSVLKVEILWLGPPIVQRLCFRFKDLDTAG